MKWPVQSAAWLHQGPCAAIQHSHPQDQIRKYQLHICFIHIRDPDSYHDNHQALLESKNLLDFSFFFFSVVAVFVFFVAFFFLFKVNLYSLPAGVNSGTADRRSVCLSASCQVFFPWTRSQRQKMILAIFFFSLSLLSLILHWSRPLLLNSASCLF